MRRAITTGALVGIVLAAFLVLPLFSGTAQAAQYSPPRADRFTFYYPDGNNTGTYNNDWVYWMGDVGYDEGLWYNWASAGDFRSQIDEDAVCSYVGHGGPGYLALYYEHPGYLPSIAYHGIRADSSMPDLVIDEVPRYTENLNDLYDLWDMRLMMLVGCETDLRNRSDCAATSLTEQAYLYRGVDCVVGFRKKIYTAKAILWDYWFWGYALDGNSVYYSCYAAKQAVYQAYGNYGNTDSYYIRGQWGTMIRPPAYGT